MFTNFGLQSFRIEFSQFTVQRQEHGQEAASLFIETGRNGVSVETTASPFHWREIVLRKDLEVGDGALDVI